MATSGSKAASDQLIAQQEQELASVYRDVYAPERQRAQGELSDLQTQQTNNARDWDIKRKAAFRNLAAQYAARGARTASQTTQQGEFDAARDASLGNDARAFNRAKANFDINYGALGDKPEAFAKDPYSYGTVGAAARNEAIRRLAARGIDFTTVDKRNA